MMDTFKRIADIASGAKVRRDREVAEFMDYYRTLVEELPVETCALFGNLSGIPVIYKGTKENYGLELSVEDYLWWKTRVENGLVFVIKLSDLRMMINHHMAKKAESLKLTQEEKKELLNILDPKN